MVKDSCVQYKGAFSGHMIDDCLGWQPKSSSWIITSGLELLNLSTRREVYDDDGSANYDGSSDYDDNDDVDGEVGTRWCIGEVRKWSTDLRKYMDVVAQSKKIIKLKLPEELLFNWNSKYSN